MPEPLDDKIRENAEGPKKASGDAGSVEQTLKQLHHDGTSKGAVLTSDLVGGGPPA